MEDNKYLAITEVNSGFKIFTSSLLNGEWKPDNKFKVDVNNIINTNGSLPHGLRMKNPEVLHKGYNQKLTIKGFNLIYQSNKNTHNNINNSNDEKLNWGLSLITKL